MAGNLAIARETEALSLDPAGARDGVRHVLADSTLGVYYVAEALEVVGQVLVTREWSDWRCGFYWWIQSVYVAPRARRTGVYRALHEHVVSEARAKGVLALRLYVDRANHGARSTYEALGMERSGYELFEVALHRG